MADRHYTFEPIAIEFSARLIRTDEDMLFSGARRLVCYEPSNGRAFSLGCELKAIPTSLVASGCAVIYFTATGALLGRLVPQSMVQRLTGTRENSRM